MIPSDQIELPRPTLSLAQIPQLLRDTAHEVSYLFLAPPGVGKSEVVAKAAEAAGLPCVSLLGTQIAPEDVSGVPRIVGERTVFCPPRTLLPERPEPFCLFLDELPACSPDVQKALYALLNERRVGEFSLPSGSWVVAAGNRHSDRAIARTLSSALVNRVFVLEITVKAAEWLAWGQRNGIRQDVLAFIAFSPSSLLRDPPEEPGPFSTPRAWASLSRALDLVDARGACPAELRRALAFGRLSPEDAALFCHAPPERVAELRDPTAYVNEPRRYAALEPSEAWVVLQQLRGLVARGELRAGRRRTSAFLRSLHPDHRMALMSGQVEAWSRLVTSAALVAPLAEVLAA